MKIVLIKLGGSIVTNKSKPLSFQKDTVGALSKELTNLIKSHSDISFVLGNGAGSFGHFMAHKTNYKENPNDLNRANEVALSVLNLNCLVVKTLQASGINAIGVQPSAFLERKPNLTGTIPKLKTMLENGTVPVFYGDVLRDDKSGTSIASTEDILLYVADQLKNEGVTISKFLLATNVDGVLDESGKTIPKLYIHDQHNSIGQGEGYDVTGGMLQKVDRGFAALSTCEKVIILNGLKPGNLSKAINDQPIGTELLS